MIVKGKALTETEAQASRAARSRSGMFSSLAHRDFRYLVSGSFTTQSGQWVQQLAKSWLVYSLTNSPFQLGLTAFFQGAGMFLFSPIGGSLADRFDRRKLMMVSQFGSMLIAFLVAFLVLFDVIRVWHIYITGFVSGALFATNNPTRQALVHDLVPGEDLQNAIALNSISANANRIVGPSVGGILLAAIGIEGAFFFQAATLLVAMVLTLKIGAIPVKARRTAFSLKEDVASSLRYIRRDKDITVLLFLGLTASILAWPYMQLLPAYTTESLGLGQGGFAVAMGAIGVGAVAASLVLAARIVSGRGWVLLAAQISAGCLLMGLGFTTIAPVAFVALGILGMATASQMATTQILLQTRVEDEYRGRVLSLYYLGFGLQPVATLPAGAVAERWGTPAALFILGAMLLVTVGSVALFSRRARTL